MAGPAPKTKGWSARENKHKPKGLHLIVGGQVEVSASNKEASLTEASPAGRVLPLNLTIKDTSQPVAAYKGKPVAVWKPASFHKEVSANQFDSVSVRWDGKEIARCPVIDDREHGALMTTRTKALNAVAGAKAKKPAAKTVAKKKTTKAVGGWAKGKKAKKKTKKVAKKSALKRFVRGLVKKLTPKKKKSKKR